MRGEMVLGILSHGKVGHVLGVEWVRESVGRQQWHLIV